MARPRVLALGQCLPYPPHSGVASRTFNILKQLEVEYDVELVAFSRASHQPDRVAREAGRRTLASVVSAVWEPTPIPNEQSRIRKMWDHARSVVTGRPYTYYEYESRAFGDRLRSALRMRHPDLVHLDSLDLYRWLPVLPQDVPVACTHHDIDWELLRQRARALAPGMSRLYLQLQAARLERLARELCPRLTLNVMMSDVDAERLRGLAPGAATAVAPNGTDTEYFQPTGAEAVTGRVAFVGPTHSHPNRDAVAFLLRDIWPLVRVGDQRATLHLIGGGPAAVRPPHAAPGGVTSLGRLPDIRPSLSAAQCSVVPIRVGGGTRLKILDAWAMGKAIVSTSVGCEGLEAVDGENILIRDTAAAFASAVLRILHDGELRSRLERNGRRTAVETYSWQVVGRGLRATYDGLIGRAAPALAAP